MVPLQRTEPAKQVGAVTAAIAILRCLGHHEDSLRLTEIVAKEGINPSTALNILRTLEYEGLVAFDRRTKRYTLASGLADLAAPLVKRDDPVTRAARAMVAAAQELHATIGLWRRVGDELELLHVADCGATIRIAFTLGRRLPMFLGAMGRLVAARGEWREEELDRGFAQVPWAKPPCYAAWKDEVTAAARDAVGIDRGHVNAGVLGVAVPLERAGPLRHVIAAALFDTSDHADPRVIAHRLRAVVDDADA